MILNAEALDIIAYLKTAPNKFVSLLEISRRAGGRRRFEEAPNWARNLMTPLVEAGVLEVNARGHYRVPGVAPRETKAQASAKPRSRPATRAASKIVGDDYFPSPEPGPRIVAGDYFPGSD